MADERAENRRKFIAHKLEDVRWRNLPIETLLAVHAIVVPKEPEAEV